MDIYAETGTPAPTVALPPLCGPMHDMTGRSYPGMCERAHRLYHLHSRQEDIDRSRRRILTRYSPRIRANLTAWVVDAQERADRIAAYVIAEWSECTHPEHERQEMTAEDALPGCTC